MWSYRSPFSFTMIPRYFCVVVLSIFPAFTSSVISWLFTCPEGYFHIRRSGGGGGGGLGPGIEFRGKIWGKAQSSSPNKRKNLGSSVTTGRKNWERITILGTFGVISEIQRAKFGVFVTYIFGGKILRHKFQRQNLGPSPPPRPPNMEVPPLGLHVLF